MYEMMSSFEFQSSGKTGCRPAEVECIKLKYPSIELMDVTKFIALDTETTGLDRKADRIIEIGALRFDNGQIIETFSTLIHPDSRIPAGATAINGITNDMVRTAPDEEKALESFVSFLGNALEGSIVLVAHNAAFDIQFLKAALERHGYSGKLCYADTLQIARRLLPDLPDYRQSTLEHFFHLHNRKAHRALSDAEICGKVFASFQNRLIPVDPAMKRVCRRAGIFLEQASSNELNMQEQAAAAAILYYGKPAHHPYHAYSVQKTSGGYVSIGSPDTVLRIKTGKRGSYVILPSIEVPEGIQTESCTRTEGADYYCRVYLSCEDELKSLRKPLLNQFARAERKQIRYFTRLPFMVEPHERWLEKARTFDQEEVLHLLHKAE